MTSRTQKLLVFLSVSSLILTMAIMITIMLSEPLATIIITIPLVLLICGILIAVLPKDSPKTDINNAINEDTERLILQMALKHNGRISPTHIAMDSPLSIGQATRILSDLEQRGFTYSAVTTHGGTEYVFPDLLEATDRNKDLDEFDNQILDFERSKQAEKEHAEHISSTHKN